MNRYSRKNFTLLEAVIALLLLTLGLGVLISQFALSGRRLLDEYYNWQISHELSNACEYLLSISPGDASKGLDRKFASDNFETSAEIQPLAMPEYLAENNENSMRIINWHVEIKNKDTGEVVEQVDFAGWVEAEYAP